jgi:hypothetical protein
MLGSEDFIVIQALEGLCRLETPSQSPHAAATLGTYA